MTKVAQHKETKNGVQLRISTNNTPILHTASSEPTEASQDIHHQRRSIGVWLNDRPHDPGTEFPTPVHGPRPSWTPRTASCGRDELSQKALLSRQAPQYIGSCVMNQHPVKCSGWTLHGVLHSLETPAVQASRFPSLLETTCFTSDHKLRRVGIYADGFNSPASLEALPQHAL